MSTGGAHYGPAATDEAAPDDEEQFHVPRALHRGSERHGDHQRQEREDSGDQADDLCPGAQA